MDDVTAVAVDNIAPPFVKVSGYLQLSCPLPDGILHIKNALLEAESDQDSKLIVQYVGAPQYRLKVTAPDYKTAEENLKRAVERAVSYIEKHNGSGRYHRENKE